jgi:hypothetical protein
MANFLRRDDWLTDAMGNALSGASVYVCSQPATTTSIPPSPLAQLYSDPNGAFPITQPVLTDGYGHAAYYVTPGTYTVVYYSPQILETILPDQTIGSGNVAFPITIPEGGTNATTAPQALINLGAAASGANADITSMSAIGTPGGAAATSTFNLNGWQFGGPGTFGPSGPNACYVGNRSWTGSGYTGYAFAVQANTGGFALMGTSGVFTSGTLQGNFIKSLGDLQIQTGGTLKVNTVTSYDPGTTLALTPSGVSGAGSVGISISGNAVLGQALLGFSSYPTQTTVGAAGGASALPATPAGYLPVSIGGTQRLIPYY